MAGRHRTEERFHRSVVTALARVREPFTYIEARDQAVKESVADGTATVGGGYIWYAPPVWLVEKIVKELVADEELVKVETDVKKPFYFRWRDESAAGLDL